MGLYSSVSYTGVICSISIYIPAFFGLGWVLAFCFVFVCLLVCFPGSIRHLEEKEELIHSSELCSHVNIKVKIMG